MLESGVQIDDVCVGPQTIDIWLHERVPHSTLVTEMYSSIKQFSNTGHGARVEVVLVLQRIITWRAECSFSL